MPEQVVPTPMSEELKLASTLPCACSDCGMYEARAAEMIKAALNEGRNKAIDECIKALSSTTEVSKILEALKHKQS